MTQSEIHAEFYNTFVKGSKNGFWLAQLRDPLRINVPEDQQIEHLFNAAVIVDCNEAFAVMYGFTSSEELVGSLILKFLVREDKRNLEIIRDFVTSDYKVEKAVTHETDRYGNPRWFLNDAFGRVEDQGLVSICGVQQEITDQKQIELDREVLLRTISRRQLIVLQLWSERCAPKQIARIMNTSQNSVYTHLKRVRKHLEISSDEALMQFAVRLGLSTRDVPVREKSPRAPVRRRTSRRTT